MQMQGQMQIKHTLYVLSSLFRTWLSCVFFNGQNMSQKNEYFPRNRPVEWPCWMALFSHLTKESFEIVFCACWALKMLSMKVNGTKKKTNLKLWLNWPASETRQCASTSNDRRRIIKSVQSIWWALAVASANIGFSYTNHELWLELKRRYYAIATNIHCTHSATLLIYGLVFFFFFHRFIAQ